MLSFVLFLVAVLLIVVIIKILPRRAWKWIGATIGIVALISVAIVGYFNIRNIVKKQTVKLILWHTLGTLRFMRAHIDGQLLTYRTALTLLLKMWSMRNNTPMN